MKKIFTILGVIFAVILVLFILAAAVFIPQALKLDRDATAYLQEALPRIVTDWNSQELVDRATPEMLAAGGSRNKLDQLFQMFKRLGSMKHLDKPVGMVTTGTYTGSGTVTIGNYKAQADFEKGPATLEIQLRRVNDTWKINGFHVHSEALLPLVTANTNMTGAVLHLSKN